MEKIGSMELYSHEEMLDSVLGKKGMPRRDKYESDINAFAMGEAIKETRLSKKLTQDQLGELIGVKRSQVSKIEKGKNLTFSTIARVFSAMRVPVSFRIEGMKEVALW